MAQKKAHDDNHLPGMFRPLLWSYIFSEIDPEKDKARIIVNTLNYGVWEHVRWITKRYGKKEIRNIIRDLPESEFNSSSLALAKILFDIESMPYATRSDKIRSKNSL